MSANTIFVAKKYKVIIPNNILFCYNQQKNTLLIKHENKKKKVKINLKLLINAKLSQLFVTNSFSKKISNNYKKKTKSFKGLLVSKIKQVIFELITKVNYQKLKFVGIGYRAININVTNSKNVFLLKLGISHSLYLNTNFDTKINSLKFTKLFIFGNSYQQVSQISASIRLKKQPEPYKGKGILFNNEIIKIKKGKKI